MARIGTPLDSGDHFPPIALPLVAGGAFDPRAAAERGWCVLLVYRGHW
jgi:hypothetical protein